jgi:FxsC-like protein
VLYFFLSYARGGDDVYVRIFFNDLCTEVRNLAGLRPEEEVGFLDNHSIHPGESWPHSLVDALSRSRAFLPLCSPRYFCSEPCGREWAIFADRIRRHEELNHARPDALIPVRWQPVQRMPRVAVPIQYFAEPQPDPVQPGKGVRQLLRLSRNRDDYLEFVTNLAERIVEVADLHSLAEGPPIAEFDGVVSAFQELGGTTAEAVNGVVPAVAVPVLDDTADRVHFVVSAPTAGTAADPAVGRHDFGYYGESPEQWAPYQPRFPGPLGDYASRIAAQGRLRARVIPVDRLDECLAQARDNNQVVIILVDPWSTKIPANRRILYRYDQRDGHRAAVMIPFSSADAETQAHAEELSESVRRTFPRGTRQPENARFRRGVLTYQSFSADLQAVLEESQNWIFANPVIRRTLPPRTAERPILEGPWETI